MRHYIKEITSCVQCPHFWDESEICHHPRWNRATHVVDRWDPVPDDCPLPENDEELNKLIR